MSQKLCRSMVVVVIMNTSFINPLSTAQSAVGELLKASRSAFITALPSLSESLHFSLQTGGKLETAPVSGGS